MLLDDALAADALAFLSSIGKCRPMTDIVSAVAPRREREVRAAVNRLAREGHVEINLGGGGGCPAYYGRKPMTRRF